MIIIKGKPKRVVFTYGVFDMLHPGHTRFLKKCKKYADFLVVSVVNNKEVKKVKGKNRPIYPLKDRVELLRELKCVDMVLTQKSYNIIPAIKNAWGYLGDITDESYYCRENLIDFVAKADDKFQINSEEWVKKCEIMFIFPSYDKEHSTSDIIKKIRCQK